MNECWIYPERETVDAAILERFRPLATSLISDSQLRFGSAIGLDPVAGLAKGQRVVGSALTVKTNPGDNLVVHRALKEIRPGQVLVVDAGGFGDRAILGEIMVFHAQAKGAVGIVIDGAIRDKEGLDDMGMPTFATAVTHIGPYKSGPGTIHGPVQIGGTVVNDGDVVIGDADGIVFVPASTAASVVEIAEGRGRNEDEMIEKAKRGEMDFGWLDEALKETHVDAEGRA